MPDSAFYSLKDKVAIVTGAARGIGAAIAQRFLNAEARVVFADADEADSIAQALQSTPRGKLRLNASVTIPPLLAPVIAEFTSLYPEVSLSMTMSDRMVDLVEEGFDLAIRLLPVPDVLPWVSSLQHRRRKRP